MVRLESWEKWSVNLDSAVFMRAACNNQFFLIQKLAAFDLELELVLSISCPPLDNFVDPK